MGKNNNILPSFLREKRFRENKYQKKGIRTTPKLMIAALDKERKTSNRSKKIKRKKENRFAFITGIRTTIMAKEDKEKYPSWFGLLKKPTFRYPRKPFPTRINANWRKTERKIPQNIVWNKRVPCFR